MKRVFGAGLALAMLAAALAGCSGSGDRADAPSAAAAPQWLAVARGTVDVEGGMVQVAARTEGVVDVIAVNAGDAVAKGQALATLDARAARIAVAGAQADVEGARAQLAESQASLRQARQRAPRVAEAAKAGAAAGESADAARTAVATLEAKQAAAAAALDAAQQTLAGAKLALDATTLRAPIAGTIVARRLALGQTVSPAAGPLFEVLPDRPHVVRAQVDADAAGTLRPGMRAEVVRDSGGGGTYSATVTWVGEVLQAATLTQDPLARALANDVDCTLELAPPAAGEAPLRIGQRVLVRFPKAAR